MRVSSYLGNTIKLLVSQVTIVPLCMGAMGAMAQETLVQKAEALTPPSLVGASTAASIGAASVRSMERFLIELEAQVDRGALSKEDALKLANERRSMMLKILQDEIAKQVAK